MYEGQPIICQKIIEENWLEYLAYVKSESEREQELSLKRQKALESVEGTRNTIGTLNEAVQKSEYRHYYDLGINSFWNWYISKRLA